MKKRLLIVCGLAVLALGPTLMSMAPANTPCVTSTYYAYGTTYPVVYGKYDTVNATGTDTFKLACACKPTSITFTNDVLKVAGSPTVTVTLYASANGGSTYASVTSFTAIPTSTSVPVTNTYIVNNPYGGNPYTNYMWVASGAATTTMSWKGTVLIR
jgi:hypothetical protein